MGSSNLVALDNDDIDFITELLEEESESIRCSIRTMYWSEETKEHWMKRCKNLVETLKAAKLDK
jgi:hypothetical protein